VGGENIFNPTIAGVSSPNCGGKVEVQLLFMVYGPVQDMNCFFYYIFIYMDLKTGDLLLFNDHSSGFFGGFTSMIKWGTHSNYSHIAMILKDPSFIHPCLKGTFVWESSWEGKPDPQDGKIKLGVQITPLQEIIDAYHAKGIFVRRVECDTSLFSPENLGKVHKVVYDKPYDIVPADWIGALFRKDLSPQKTSRFWCSALVGYIYTQCGLLESATDWSILRPSDFSLAGENLKFCEGVKLNNSESKLSI